MKLKKALYGLKQAIRVKFKRIWSLWHIVSVKFTQECKLSHMQVAKRMMRYLKDPINNDILFPKPYSHWDKLRGFCNSDWCWDGVENKKKNVICIQVVQLSNFMVLKEANNGNFIFL